MGNLGPRPFVFPELDSPRRFWWFATEAMMVASLTLGGMKAGEYKQLCDNGQFDMGDPIVVFGSPANGSTDCQGGLYFDIAEQVIRGFTWVLMRYFGFTFFLVDPYGEVFAGPTLDLGIGATTWTGYEWGHVRPTYDFWSTCTGGDVSQFTSRNFPGPLDCRGLRYDSLSVTFGWLASVGMMGEILAAIVDMARSTTKLHKFLGITAEPHGLRQEYPDTSYCFSYAPHALALAGIILRGINIQDTLCVPPGDGEDCGFVNFLNRWDLVLYGVTVTGIIYATDAARRPDSTLAQLAYGPTAVAIAMTYGNFVDGASTPFWEACAFTSDIAAWVQCGPGECADASLAGISSICRWLCGYILADRFIRAFMTAVSRFYIEKIDHSGMLYPGAANLQMAETGIAGEAQKPLLINETRG